MIFVSTSWLDPWMAAAEDVEESEVKDGRKAREISKNLPLEHGR